jgi:hypothetical protein
MLRATIVWTAVAAASSLALPGAASAAEHAIFLNAPAAGSQLPRLATVFELKLRLPQGLGLARLLLDAGVSEADAAEAARLAAGHCDAVGGCDAKVAISRELDSGLRVERVLLMSASGQTVIERRDGRLALNPTAVPTTRAAAVI